MASVSVASSMSGAERDGEPAISASPPSSLTDQLSARLSSLSVKAALPPPASPRQDLHLVFCEPRHGGLGEDDDADEALSAEGLVSKWRQKERLKTTAVALVVCLNIGVDPPDVIKISPCARLECWVDPLSMQAPKALDTIGKNLQAQYERWQPRAKYKMHLDPTTEDVKKLAISCRRTAKHERVLFHYNGHGVPRPTANGEVWVFNKSYTQYIPLSLYDLQTWVGSPAIFIFDCSVAGQILFSFKQFMLQRAHEVEGYSAAGGGYPVGQDGAPVFRAGGDPMKDCILLCACSESELLPQNPDLPADVFTACLTTPIKVALRWFCSRSLLRHEGVTKELIDRIPGKQTDRKTPLGELNWIFTAITDTIAWNVLPRALFQKLFRQDLLVASLFRNFLLAERIMRAANCTPVSHPRLPPTHQHPMWQAWDMAAEMCLLQLPDLLQGDGSREYAPSPFFAEQLTAFELWLEHGSADKTPPEQLPIVLQVLLSQVHRLRALVLLGRFLDMGSWAVDLALSVGIFPYVLKLLQTTAPDLRKTLVFIWAKIMAWDANAQVQSDLIKDGGHLYFIKHLESQEPGVGPESRAQAAFVLAAICNGNPKGQMLCAQAGLVQVCAAQLPAALAAAAEAEHADPVRARDEILLAKWLIMCIGKVCEDMPELTAMALRDGVHELLMRLLAADDPEVRAAAVFALGALIQAVEFPAPEHPPAETEAQPALLPEQERLVLERAIIAGLLEVVYDGSPLVRAEVARALARVAMGHSVLFQDAVHAHQKTSARILRAKSSPASQGMKPASAETTQSAPAGGVSGSGASSGGDVSWPGQQSSSSAGKFADEMQMLQCVAHSPRCFAGKPASAGSLQDHSPGVRMRDDFSYEPMLHVGLDKSNLGGVYASADAARVGGGLYHAVVEALCTLAVDLAAQVSKAGRSALEAAHVEMVFIGQRSAPAGLASLRPPQTSPQSLPPVPPGSASGMSSFLPKSWQSKSWRSFSQTAPRPAPASSAAGSSAASSPEGSTSFMGADSQRAWKPPFVLRMMPDSGDLEGTVHRGSELRSVPAVHLRLGPSQVYLTSCKQYRWPSLPPLALEERGPDWLRPPPPNKIQERIAVRDEGIVKCAAVGSMGVRIREQVLTVNTSAERTTALLLEPLKPRLVTADGDGNIRVNDYAYQTLMNQFSISSDPGSSAIKALYRINALYNEVLMCCTSDGGVSVWRDYATRGRQRLATAWQSVLVPSQGMPCSEAIFCYSSVHLGGTLYAAGGRSLPRGLTINAWDLHREYCVSQLGNGEMEDQQMASVVQLAVSEKAPVLYAAEASGNVRVFDLRARQQVQQTQPSKDHLVGMVADPGGVENQLILGYRNGTLNFLDCRVFGGSSPSVSLLRSVEGHSKGNMTTLCGHSCAPLIASATTSQVVKIWSLRGEQVGVVRPHSSILGQPIGPTTCLAFAPYSLQLASGGGDSICAVYSLELGSQA